MTDSFDRPARVLVAYYSAAGHVYALAKALAQGAEIEGAEARVRPVEELAPQMVISRTRHGAVIALRSAPSRRRRWAIWTGPTGSPSARRPDSATWPPS